MKNYSILILNKLEKRILILFLFLATGATAQIGVGTRTPHQDAMLEVVSTNKGLLLPRVALTSISSPAPLNTHVAGMSVYNTATTGDVTIGIYYSDGTKWIKLASGASNTYTGSISTVLNGTSFERAALTGDVTAALNSNVLVIANDVITSEKILNATIATDDLADNAVTTDKISNGAITIEKLNLGTAASGQVLKYDGTTWAPAADVGLTTTTVINDITSGALTTTVNGVASQEVTLPVESATDTPSSAITASTTQVAVSSTNVQGAISDLATAVKTASNSNIYAADGSLAGNREITQGVNTLAFTSSATTGTSHFTVDGTTLNVDAVNNRLGVGTATPGEALHVVGNVRSSSLASGTGNGNKMVIASETGVLSTQDIPVTATNLVKVTTATYTSTSTNNSILVDVPTGGATVTLPAASANNGKILTIKKVDDDTDVLTLSLAVKVTASESFSTLNFATTVTIQSDGTNWWLIN